MDLYKIKNEENKFCLVVKVLIIFFLIFLLFFKRDNIPQKETYETDENVDEICLAIKFRN